MGVKISYLRPRNIGLHKVEKGIVGLPSGHFAVFPGQIKQKGTIKVIAHH